MLLKRNSRIRDRKTFHRLTAQIKDSNPILTGLSFGEIMAIKVAKLINIEKIKRNTILLQDCRNNQPKEHLSKP